MTEGQGLAIGTLAGATVVAALGALNIVPVFTVGILGAGAYLAGGAALGACVGGAIDAQRVNSGDRERNHRERHGTVHPVGGGTEMQPAGGYTIPTNATGGRHLGGGAGR